MFNTRRLKKIEQQLDDILIKLFHKEHEKREEKTKCLIIKDKIMLSVISYKCVIHNNVICCPSYLGKNIPDDFSVDALRIIQRKFSERGCRVSPEDLTLSPMMTTEEFKVLFLKSKMENKNAL